MAVDQSTVEAAGMDPFARRMASLERQQGGLQTQEEALLKQGGALSENITTQSAARAEALKPLRNEQIAQLDKAPRGLPAETQAPKYERPTIKPEEMNQTFGMLMAASMLVGAGSRTPFYGVMNAMTGAMSGFVKEDHAIVEESMKTFDKDMATIKENNAQLRRHYDDGVKLWQRDFKAGQQKIEMTAAQFDDPIALDMARKGQIDAAVKQIDSRLRSVDTSINSMERLRAQVAQQQQAHADRMLALNIAHQDRVAALAQKAGAAGGGAAGTNTGGLSADYQNDPEYAKQVDFWAKYMKDGNTLPPRFAQSGAGKKMFSDIVSRVPQLGGGDPREIQANAVALTGQRSEARALGTRTAAIEQAASEAREMSSIVLDTSEKFKRTGYQPINRVWSEWEKNTGSTEVRQFGASLNSYINAYARAVNPTGVGTVHDKEHARDMLSTADSHEQVKAIIQILDREMTAAQHSPQNVKDSLRNEITGRRASDTGGDLRTKVEAAGGTYEPDKYDYRVAPDGKVQRKAK